MPNLRAQLLVVSKSGPRIMTCTVPLGTVPILYIGMVSCKPLEQARWKGLVELILMSF